MGNLPQALPKTVIAADHVRRHAGHPVIKDQATDLLQAAAWAEVLVADGGRSAMPPELLRELFTVTGVLAGRRWLRANAASPAVETFTTLCRAPRVAALPALDQVLSAVLWSRFSIPGSAGGVTRKARNHPGSSRLARFGARRHRATA